MLHTVLRRNTKDGIRIFTSISQQLSSLTEVTDLTQFENSSYQNTHHDLHLRRTYQLNSLKSFRDSQYSSLVSQTTHTQSHVSPRHYYSSSSSSQSQSQPPVKTGTWLDHLPQSWIPYAQLSRLEKPIGTWLLAWPCFWSIALASPPGHAPDLHTLALFGAGSILLRGAGCTVNDLWDQDLDKKVERTRTRPLPSGALTSSQAIAWLGAQLAAGSIVLLQFDPYSIALGASSLGLVAAYPLMKRITGWPQAFLGLTFNWGALLGWAAVRGECDWSVVLPLYAGGVFWTLVYDTIYAHQDKTDDVVAGIKSTAITFGRNNKLYLSAFGGLNMTSMSLAGLAAGCGPLYYFSVLAGGSHLLWQVSSVNLDDAKDCGDIFRSNVWYGALLFSGIVLDRLLM